MIEVAIPPLARMIQTMAFVLSSDPILTDAPPFEPEEGAEARFLGVVRSLEQGRVISGIDYSAYVPMAEKTLAALIASGQARRGAHQVFIQHRLGFVPAQEPSLLLRVRAKHSAEAFELCQWYLREIKTKVPIWKKPVWAD